MFVAMCDSNAALGSTMPGRNRIEVFPHTPICRVMCTWRRDSVHGTQAPEWPEEFVILSAYATTGQTWTHEQNRTADRQPKPKCALGGWFDRRLLALEWSLGPLGNGHAARTCD